MLTLYLLEYNFTRCKCAENCTLDHFRGVMVCYHTHTPQKNPTTCLKRKTKELYSVHLVKKVKVKPVYESGRESICNCTLFMLSTHIKKKHTRNSKCAMNNIRVTAECKTPSHHTESTVFYWLDEVNRSMRYILCVPNSVKLTSLTLNPPLSVLV